MIVFVVVPSASNTVVVVDSMGAILRRSNVLGSLHGGGRQCNDEELAKVTGVVSIYG